MSDAEIVLRRLRPKTAKAHAPRMWQGQPKEVARCGQVVPRQHREVVPLVQTAPEDRCTRCWPELRA